jgi:hypothetical protein
MNTKQFIVAVAIVAAYGAVNAQETESVNPAKDFVSTKTRAQVIDELKQARADGSYVMVGSEEYPGHAEAMARRHRMVGEPTDVARDSKPEMPVSGS